jgi:cysteine desulfurase
MTMSHGKELYLDHAATTPLHPEALGAMLPYYGNHYGLPGSPSVFGDKARRALEGARDLTAGLIKAQPGEIVFTSSGTEANNLAILGGVRAKGAKGKHLITSQGEHSSVLNVFRHLEQEGFRVTFVPVDSNGRVDPGAVESAIEDDTLLISIMHASHAVGTVQPIREIGAIARNRGITFHVDAAQSAGWLPLSMEDLPVDLLSISSHKLYGPKGAGALYIRQDTEITPVMFGLRQEKGLRPGAENITGIVGFGIACAMAGRDLVQHAMLVTSLRESLEQQILNSIQGASVHALSAERLPHITTVTFEGIPGDAVASYLDVLGIVVAAATRNGRDPEDLSPVLEAMYGREACTWGALRVSLGWENKEREIRRTVESLETALSRIQAFSSASEGKELVFFTFPHREGVAQSFEALDGKGFPVSLITRPDTIMNGSSSPVSLCALACDREAIGAELGRLNIEISGIHAMNPRKNPMSDKERAFWGKVDKIREGVK